jgi:hypothetical protein
VISGEFRAIDTALNQRYVMVPLRKNENPKKLEEARAASAFLSAYTVTILQDYEAQWQSLDTSFKAVKGRWQKILAGKVDIRIIENYAKVFVALQNVGEDLKREERFLIYMQEKVSESGNMNPALEALKFMPNFMLNKMNAHGWIPLYIDLKKNRFNVDPAQLSRMYCDFTRQVQISTDDLFKYAQEAGIVDASQKTRLGKVSLKMSQCGSTLGRSGWRLNMAHETVREIAEELESLCDKNAVAKGVTDDDTPNIQ